MPRVVDNLVGSSDVHATDFCQSGAFYQPVEPDLCNLYFTSGTLFSQSGCPRVMSGYHRRRTSKMVQDSSICYKCVGFHGVLISSYLNIPSPHNGVQHKEKEREEKGFPSMIFDSRLKKKTRNGLR